MPFPKLMQWRCESQPWDMENWDAAHKARIKLHNDAKRKDEPPAPLHFPVVECLAPVDVMCNRQGFPLRCAVCQNWIVQRVVTP